MCVQNELTNRELSSSTTITQEKIVGLLVAMIATAHDLPILYPSIRFELLSKISSCRGIKNY
jgi:hypothetical protein